VRQREKETDLAKSGEYACHGSRKTGRKAVEERARRVFCLKIGADFLKIHEKGAFFSI